VIIGIITNSEEFVSGKDYNEEAASNLKFEAASMI